MTREHSPDNQGVWKTQNLNWKTMPSLDSERALQGIEKKREFVRVASRVREALQNIEDKNTSKKLAFVNAVKKLCTRYGVRLHVPFKVLDGVRHGRAVPAQAVDDLFDQILSSLEELKVDIAVHDAIFEDHKCIKLNDNWKSRAGAYIMHIREIVSNAEVKESIKERILLRLNELQLEVDRNRTHVETITEVFLSITEAVSKGAKHLDGAVKLVEKLAGALSGARSLQLEREERKQLPAPDDLNLPEPE